MKLLLTSNGLSNDSIANALKELVGKEPKDTKIAFIPTAANPERGDKSWLIMDLYRLLERGYYIDVIELTATKPAQLSDILQDFDVIFVGGGNTFYLSYWMQKSGLFDLLPELLATKVYASISAGSMISGKSLALDSRAIKNPQAFADADYDTVGPRGESSGKTLQLVDFLFRPHLNSRFFTMARIDLLEEKARQLKLPIYALDDNSALKIVDGKVEVISEGEWKLL